MEYQSPVAAGIPAVLVFYFCRADSCCFSGSSICVAVLPWEILLSCLEFTDSIIIGHDILTLCGLKPILHVLFSYRVLTVGHEKCRLSKGSTKLPCSIVVHSLLGVIQSPDCPARSKSLYRLSYPGPLRSTSGKNTKR
jgi:hypothetical protein